jgi:hypothetical protein
MTPVKKNPRTWKDMSPWVLLWEYAMVHLLGKNSGIYFKNLKIRAGNVALAVLSPSPNTVPPPQKI